MPINVFLAISTKRSNKLSGTQLVAWIPQGGNNIQYFTSMIDQTTDFVNALESFVKAELRLSMEPADYNNEASEIIDARNRLFRNVGRQSTDEELGIYAIRDLCQVDEDTMETIPNRMKFLSIARTYFG